MLNDIENQPQKVEPIRPKRRRALRWLGILAGIVLVLIVAAVGGLFYLHHWVNLHAREWVQTAVAKRMASEVEVGSLSVSLYPGPAASGTNLIVRHHGRHDVPPLIAIGAFKAQTTWTGFVRKHIDSVDLVGLRITVPPKGSGPKAPPRSDVPKQAVPMPHINRLTADDARLLILPKKAGKDPLDFELHELRITDVDPRYPMKYQSKLTNAKPPGLIDSKGYFGPWNANEPGDTPLGGDYTFDNADLSVFKGISGKLSAKGGFKGALNHIETEGTATVPDFATDVARQPIRLRNDYHAIVDGTDGDTYLQPVKAQWGNTVIVARGAVEGLPGRHGKGVRLDVQTERARIEDILKLAVKSDKTILTGNMSFSTKFFLPPGHEDVVRKLMLDGRFGLDRTHFSRQNIQDKIDTLSRKGQGQPRNQEIDDVASNFKGSFRLKTGLLTLSKLTFEVPGAHVALDGNYKLQEAEIDFTGRLFLDAPISKTTTGIKSVLLKPFDPLFSKRGGGGGSEVPIWIRGTPSSPQFGVDLKKTLRRQ